MVCFKSRQCNTSILQVLFILFIIALGYLWSFLVPCEFGDSFWFLWKFLLESYWFCYFSGESWRLIQQLSSTLITGESRLIKHFSREYRSAESVECLVGGWDHVIPQKINTIHELHEADTQRPLLILRQHSHSSKVQSQNKAYGLGNQDHVGLDLLAVLNIYRAFVFSSFKLD